MSPEMPAGPPAELFHVLPADFGRMVGVVGDAYRFLAVGAQTAGRYALWEAIVPPGGGPPLHVHSRESEGFFILSGQISVTIDDRKVIAAPGDYIHLEPGTRHGFRNESGQPARMLILVTPAGLENYFFEIGVPLKSIDEPIPHPTPADIAKLLAAAPRYGLTVFPPEPPPPGE